MFGSRARGDAGPLSDVDLLVVVDAALPIARSLYRVWDQSLAGAPALQELGASVNPHFVHLPRSCAGNSGDGGGSLWLEVALHGIVLWQRTWELSRVGLEMRASVWPRG